MPADPSDLRRAAPGRSSRPVVRTIDAHAEGGPLRLIVDGFPSPRGRTLADKCEWLRRHADDLRRALTREPRGHAGTLAAALTEPVLPGSHAGIVFMDADGYPALSGHGAMAAAQIALDRRLVVPGGDGRTIVFDTVAGVVKAVVVGRAVSVGLPPSFVLHGGLTVKAMGRQFRADVAFAGVFYAIVDGEAAGLALDWAHLPDLARAGAEIRRAIDAVQPVVHPAEPSLRGLGGVIFTAPPSDERAAIKAAAVTGNGRVDRSPSGTGTAAVMAVVDAMGLMADGAPFVQEGLTGARFSARIVGRTGVGEVPAIMPEIEGTTWTTGEHAFVLDGDDPLRTGFPP